jgi:hypothetical protein
MGETRNIYKILVGKSERKRSLGRQRHWWEDNIKMNHGETGCGDVDRVHLAQDRGQLRVPVKTVISLLVP